MFNLRLVISLLAAGGILFAALNFNQQPLFDNTESFVLFADRGITLEQETQVSSGDLGSNNKINIQKDNIINGNLFAKEIEIDKDTQINGNASFDKLKPHKDSRILGTTSSPVSLPVAELPEIPDFQIGSQDLKFTGQNNVLNQGSYRNILIEKDSRLTLTGGIYNLNKLELKENSTLIYNSPTTVNIQSELKTRQHIAILPGNNDLEPLDLTVNYHGKVTIDDGEDEDGDDNDNNNDDNGDNNENKKTKSRFQNFRERLSSFFQKLFGFLKKTDDRKNGGVKPVQFGNDSFLNFKLLAPSAKVKLGERTTFRGQVLGREIKIGRNSIFSRLDFFANEVDPAKIVEDQGFRFVVNEILMFLEESATENDVRSIADLVGGRITAAIQKPNAFKVEVLTQTAQELDDKIQIIKDSNNPLILYAIPNIILELR